MIGAIATAAGSLISGLSSIFGGAKQKKLGMRDINNLGTYETSDYAKNYLGLANNLYNSRMGGAAQAENNILTNQANTSDLVERAATDPNMILALAGATQGQTNNALSNLAATEAEDRMRRAGILADAEKTMIGEGQAEWNDKLRQLQQKIGVRAVGAQNTQNGVNAVGSGISMFGNIFEDWKNSKKTGI